MSCQQDKNAGFELDATDFPELSHKLTGRKEKGRRCAAAAKHARRAGKTGAFLVKTIDDPNHVLGKRRRERYSSECNDGIAFNVVYSMNKNNRWNEMTSSTLLDSESELPIAVVERVISAKASNIATIHTIDSTTNTICTISTPGKGSDLKDVLTGKGEKPRTRKTRRERELSAAAAAEAAAAADRYQESLTDWGAEVIVDESNWNVFKFCEEVAPQRTAPKPKPFKLCEPKIHYNIFKPHKNQQMLAGKQLKKNLKNKKMENRRQQSKKIVIDEMVANDLDQSVHIEEPDYKPSRDLKFCLGDYIVESEPTSRKSSSTAPVFVRRQSIESNNDDVNRPTQSFPEIKKFDAKNIIDGVDNWFTVKTHDTSKWQLSELSEQIKEIADREDICVRWLDQDHTRVLIDVHNPKKLSQHSDFYTLPPLTVILEKGTTKHQLKIRINCDEYGHFRKYRCLPAAVTSVRELIDELKFGFDCREPIYPLEKPNWDICDFDEWNYFSSENDHYSWKASVNVTKYYDPMGDRNKITFPKQWAVRGGALVEEALVACWLLKNGFETDEMVRSESFERINLDLVDEIDFADEGANVLKSATEDDEKPKAKCSICEESESWELFELEDCWQCRECLRTMIYGQIERNELPISVPFVLEKGVSAYQMLFAVLPMPIIRYYTRLMASQYKNLEEFSDLDSTYCPKCKTEQMSLPKDRSNYRFSQCSKCDTSYCGLCHEEPHWPMTCEQFGAWSSNWDHYYQNHDDYSGPTCRSSSPPLRRSYSDECFLCQLKFTSSPPIRQEFIKFCGTARKMRSESAVFDKSFRQMKIATPLKIDVINTRKAVLYLIEQGLGSIYVTKDRSELKQELTQFLKQWKDFEADVSFGNVNSHRFSAIKATLKKIETSFEQLE